MKRERLSQKSWIEAGLSELASEGPKALAAEPLARKLGTTKGSFYWHFKDVPDFQKAIVKHWQSDAFAEMLHALEDNGKAEQRLRRFGKNILGSKNDPAIRAWGRADKNVAKALAQVDGERLKYINALLRHMGISNDDFARSALATLIGLPEVSNKSQASRAYDSLVDTVLSLQ